MRRSVAQSTATSTRSPRSAGSSWWNTSPSATRKVRSVGHRGRVGVREHHVLAGGPQRARQAEQRADRVAVGVVVRGHDEALARAREDLGDRGRVGVAAGGRAHGASSTPPPSAVISSMRRLSATASCCERS